jgi:hypothetical protein
MDDLAVDWRAPWSAIVPEQRPVFEQELQQELTAGHPLYGVAASACARNEQDDDVLFRLRASAQPYAVVHLVWQGPQQSPWPETRVFASVEDGIERCMQPDHAAYATATTDEDSQTSDGATISDEKDGGR